MDCDYPVPDIYDDYIVDDGCYPCGPYTSNDEQDEDPNKIQDKPQTYGFPVVEAECGCNARTRKFQPVNERKEKCVLKKIAEEEEHEDNIKVEDCCTHGGGRNDSGNQSTFLLTFGTSDGDDDCKLDEKTRCKAFWKYVDSNELLQALVREGEFVYEHPPQQIQPKSIGNLTMRKNKKTLEEENFAYLAERNRAVHEDEEKRLFKQRRKNLELQYKSGQIASLNKKKDVATIKKGPKYADLCEPTISDVMREMKIFDSLTNNPVKVPEIPDPDQN